MNSHDAFAMAESSKHNNVIANALPWKTCADMALADYRAKLEEMFKNA